MQRLDRRGLRTTPRPPTRSSPTAAHLRRGLPRLAESIRRSRGRPPKPEAKLAVTLRLDPDTLARFKAQGPDWRTRMSEALKRAREADRAGRACDRRARSSEVLRAGQGRINPAASCASHGLRASGSLPSHLSSPRPRRMIPRAARAAENPE